MDEQNWKAQMDAVHDVLDTKVGAQFGVWDRCPPREGMDICEMNPWILLKPTPKILTYIHPEFGVFLYRYANVMLWSI